MVIYFLILYRKWFDWIWKYWSVYVNVLYWFVHVNFLYWSVHANFLYWYMYVNFLYWSVYANFLYWSVYANFLYWSVYVNFLYWSVYANFLYWSVYVNFLYWSVYANFSYIFLFWWEFNYIIILLNGTQMILYCNLFSPRACKLVESLTLHLWAFCLLDLCDLLVSISVT